MKRPCKCIESSVRSGEDTIMNFNTTGARRIHCLTGYTGYVNRTQFGVRVMRLIPINPPHIRDRPKIINCEQLTTIS